MSIDQDGGIYLADQPGHRILKIDAAGTVSVIAGGQGGSGGGFNGNDRAAKSALLKDPIDVKVGPDRRIYLSDSGNKQIRVIDRTGVIRMAPGLGVALSSACFGAVKGKEAIASPSRPPVEPLLNGSPSSVVVATDGSLYFSLPQGHEVKRLSRKGLESTVIGAPPEDRLCSGGLGCAGFSGDGGPAVRATLRNPTALALSPQGGLYVFDGGSGASGGGGGEDAPRVRYLNTSNLLQKVHGAAVKPGWIETVAGNGMPGSTGDNGPAKRAELGPIELIYGSGLDPLQAGGILKPKLTGGGARPYRGALDSTYGPLVAFGSLAADGKGSLYIADTANHRVRRVGPSGIIETIAGEGVEGLLGDCCKDPVAVAVDSAGAIYVGNRGAPATAPIDPLRILTAPRVTPSPRIWLLNLDSQPKTVRGVVVEPKSASALAGNGGFGLKGDGGRALESEMLVPMDIDFDHQGNLYIAETGLFKGGGGQIRMIDKGGLIRTVAGNGQEGFNGDGLKATVTRLRLPTGIALDGCGNLFIADLGNDRVRRVDRAGSCVPGKNVTEPVGGRNWGLLPVAGGVLLVAVLGAIGFVSSNKGVKGIPD